MPFWACTAHGKTFLCLYPMKEFFLFELLDGTIPFSFKRHEAGSDKNVSCSPITLNVSTKPLFPTDKLYVVHRVNWLLSKAKQIQEDKLFQNWIRPSAFLGCCVEDLRLWGQLFWRRDIQMGCNTHYQKPRQKHGIEKVPCEGVLTKKNWNSYTHAWFSEGQLKLLVSIV